MGKLVLWSDLHLGHDNAIKWRTRFDTPEEHDEYLFDKLASSLCKRDVCYLLGDLAFTDEWLIRLAGLQEYCQAIHVVLGNHDTEDKPYRVYDKSLYFTRFASVHSLLKKGPFWLSHAPIHPQELRGKLNAHGHTHLHNITKIHRVCGFATVDLPDKHYINVCPEATNWEPVIYQQLIELLKDEGVLDKDFKPVV